MSAQVPPPPGQPWPPQEPGSLLPPQPGQWQPARWPGQPRATNGLAVAAMVLGIVGLLAYIFLIPQILGLLFGLISRGQIRRSGEAQAGSGMAVAGIVMGIIGILLFVLLIATGGAFSYYFR